MKDPPRIGERIIVYGYKEYDVRVKEIEYVEEEARYLIRLDWGIHGASKVYDSDEGKIWVRWNSLN